MYIIKIDRFFELCHNETVYVSCKYVSNNIAIRSTVVKCLYDFEWMFKVWKITAAETKAIK